jgi:hypothetical protein
MIASKLKNVKQSHFVSLQLVSYASESIMEAEQNAMVLANKNLF